MSLTNWITDRPKLNILLLFFLICIVSYGINNFELDASSETLLLENDPDLKLYRENTEIYGSSDFLVVTFSPNDELLSVSTINNIKKLVNDLKQVKGVESVLSLLDVPLIVSSANQSLSEVADNVSTLNANEIDINLAKKVFSTNPVYKNLLISEDLKTTAFQLTLKRNFEYEKLINNRYTLYGSLSNNKDKEINEVNRLIEVEKKLISIKEKELVSSLRNILLNYSNSGELFLGGGAMIASDTIEFISQDLLVFGIAVLIIFIIVLAFIFKSFIWVMIPLATAGLTSLLSIGAVGWFGWKVTVVSANFISILMIIGISLMVHLIVRYQELAVINESSTQKELVSNTLKQMFLPCLYTR